MNNNSHQKPLCPYCGSEATVKNGSTPNKKPKHKCKICGRQFVQNPTKKYISSETKKLIDDLLLEKIPLAGIARVTKVTTTWLQNYLNKKYEETRREVKVSRKSKGTITIDCDRMHYARTKKTNKQWIWLALDKDTKEIVGAYIGNRDSYSAQKFWESLPPVYRQCAVCYTYFGASYNEIIPQKRHKRVGKETGLTHHIERFNNTMRQRVSRKVRKTLSFSKKLDNHIGAIWNFIHHYNKSIIQSS